MATSGAPVRSVVWSDDVVRRTLLISNDFPPRTGGIQSYVHELATRLPAGRLVVYAPAWPGAVEFDAAQPFPVIRHPGSLMLPLPTVARRARQLIDHHSLSAVWFGAAAPLALLVPHLRTHGVERAVASTHGHEVGWSMLPGSRQALRRIGGSVDVVTFISRYARHRIAAALGPMACLEYLPPGVDGPAFRPDAVRRAEIRARWELAEAPVLVCISRLVRRKGQDQLIKALPAIRARLPGAILLLVGDGPDRNRLRRLADRLRVADHVRFTGPVRGPELAAHYAAADVFAMPCRTRGGGLDVEGLGIVFLEAGAAGLPVLAGDSGGAPEAVLDGQTGEIVDGRDTAGIAAAAAKMLGDPTLRRSYGDAGRKWVAERWTWQASADRLAELLSG